MGSKCSSENGHIDVKKPKIGHWNRALTASMEVPKLIVYSDDCVVIIKDKYPKARYHYLTLPKRNIPCLKAVNKSHLPLLKHMHEKAEELCTKSKSKYKFQIGYHAIPSMSHLHLHVISQDFDGPYLKTNMKWNSFTTEFFMSSNKIIEQLKSIGQIKFMDTDELLKLLMQSLRCHICKKEIPTLPKLKEHIKSCAKKFQSWKVKVDSTKSRG